VTTYEYTETQMPRLIAIETAALRKVLGQFCTGVAVVTAHDGHRALGFTCQSLTSVSLDPPYISFCPARTSTTWPLIRRSGAVCVNILAAEQRDICARFATRGGNKFAGVRWTRGANGAPVLDGALASVEAEIAFEHIAGDHTIVVAHVTSLGADDSREPLLFFRGGYGVFSRELALEA
jgi:3-hydroxy-9,10-secoandrosta-1,3,5(10)-triene-9,17-dione monooxygenase reductase component